jgi:hypothetical protein
MIYEAIALHFLDFLKPSIGKEKTNVLPNQVTYQTYRIQALDICTNENEGKFVFGVSSTVASSRQDSWGRSNQKN